MFMDHIHGICCLWAVFQNWGYQKLFCLGEMVFHHELATRVAEGNNHKNMAPA